MAHGVYNEGVIYDADITYAITLEFYDDDIEYNAGILYNSVLYGRVSTTLIAELNRLANGGAYPLPKNFKGLGGAVNAWAGTVGKGLLGALNYKANPARTPINYKGLGGVCNELAGTTDKSPIAALRSIASWQLWLRW